MGGIDSYNAALCRREHERIDEHLMEGKIRMDSHEAALNAHSEQLAIMRELAKRRDSLFWNLISPVLSFVGAVAAGAVLAWFLKGG